MNYRNYVSMETAERLYQVFHGVFLTGKPETGVSCEILGKNGKARWVEVSIQLMKDKNGKPEGFRGLVREMTTSCHELQMHTNSVEGSWHMMIFIKGTGRISVSQAVSSPGQRVFHPLR